MSRIERFAISALLFAATCTGCARAVHHYDGIPANAAGMTYCDHATGQIRTVIDAEMLVVDSEGGLHSVVVLPEVLVHETMHRIQQESRRPKPGVCPRDYTIPELVQSELEAHCAAYTMALIEGQPVDSVGRRYAPWVSTHIQQFLKTPARDFLKGRWDAICPGRPLIWDDQ